MHSVSVMEVLKQQYTSCMKVGTGRNLDLSREYHKKLFGSLFHSWWNCPLTQLILGFDYLLWETFEIPHPENWNVHKRQYIFIVVVVVYSWSEM